MRTASARVLQPLTLSFVSEIRFLRTWMQYSAFTRSRASRASGNDRVLLLQKKIEQPRADLFEVLAA